MSLRALHLARVADSLKTLAGFLEAGIEPVVVNTDPSIRYEFVPALEARIPVASNLYHEVKIPSPRLARYASLLPEIPMPWHRALVRRLAEVLDGSGPVDFVFAHWGATVIPEIRLLLAAGRRAPPVILNMETFPTAWRRGARERLEVSALRGVARSLRGAIVTNPEMREYLRGILGELPWMEIHPRPFYYPRSFAPEDDRAGPAAPEERGIVFLGQADFSDSLNDVREELRALAQAGLAVHCVRMDGLAHENIRFFPAFGGEKMTSGETASLLRRFRACLVTYRLPSGQAVPIRFRTSYPSRLLIALAAGVPILLPRGKFPAMERLVLEHGIGHAYDSPEDAFRFVESSACDAVRAQALRKRSEFLFDAESFRGFCARVIRPASVPNRAG